MTLPLVREAESRDSRLAGSPRRWARTIRQSAGETRCTVGIASLKLRVAREPTQRPAHGLACFGNRNFRAGNAHLWRQRLVAPRRTGADPGAAPWRAPGHTRGYRALFSGWKSIGTGAHHTGEL